MKSMHPRRALAAAVLASGALLLCFSAAMGRPQAAGSGERRVLRVAVSSSTSAEILQISGVGAELYELTIEAGGAMLLRFPGAELSPVEEGAEQMAVPVTVSAPDTLVIPAQARLAGIEAAPSTLRIHLARGPQGMAVWQAYRLGVGDKIRLDIYGDAEFSEREMRVVDDGTIAVPYLGDVQVAGLSVTEAAEFLSQRLAAGYLVDPKVSVEVVEYQSQWVNVSGQVEKPGRYYLEGPTRLVDIIARAGGLKREAGMDVRLTRPGPPGTADRVWTFSRASLYMTDDPESNPYLQSGDSVTVSSEEYFFIKGEVKSPGRYALDGDTTILKAISLAGGFEQYANHKKVELLRKQDEETVRMVINVERIQNRKDEDVPILPGDIINVRARFL
jgi:polysaccharide export outer membrane protein